MPQHFRDRVILSQGNPNIPQLPTGRRTGNIIGLSQLGQNAATLTTLVVNIYSIDAPAASITVPTQTTNATSP